jgi:hypothetical protein
VALEGRARELADGRRLLQSEANRYDTVRRLVYSQHRYEVFDAEGNLERTFVHSFELAFLYAADLERMLGDAGFVDVRISGDFSGRPVQHDGDELVVSARRGD